MKVIQSIEAIYEEQKAINVKLKKRVDEIFTTLKKDNWHYFSRIKQLESFALKLETGRFSNSSNLHDFFACTLVVDNLNQINKANALIRSKFNIVSQKPQNSRFTHKEPSSFQFDDLRLYGTLHQPSNMPHEPITEITFEIQIKTFIQHAWGLATHDLIYKSDEINWSKERIAFQIKAVLEQAEVTISGVNNLINLPEVSKDNPETTEYKKILKFYRDLFSREDLPTDLVRLCKNTAELISNLELKLADIKEIIRNETVIGKGTNIKNLSPYLVVVQSIINRRKDIIETYLNSPTEHKFKLLLPKEIDISALNIRTTSSIVKLDSTSC